MGSAFPKGSRDGGDASDIDYLEAVNDARADRHPSHDAFIEAYGEVELRIEMQFQGLHARQEMEKLFGEGLISR